MLRTPDVFQVENKAITHKVNEKHYKFNIIKLIF